MAGPFFSEVLLLDQTSIIIVYLIVQFIAFAGARLAGYLAGRIGQKNTLLFTITLFFIAGNSAFVVPEKQLIPVIILGVVVGLGMGGYSLLVEVFMQLCCLKAQKENSWDSFL